MVMFVKGGCFRQTDPLLTMSSASTVMLTPGPTPGLYIFETRIVGIPATGFRVFLRLRTIRGRFAREDSP